MYLSPEIPAAALWLLLGSFACVLLLAAFYAFRVRNVVSYRRESERRRAEKPDSEYQPVSVVVYSDGAADNLEKLLRDILSQNYPAAFELIVVNEGESPDVRDTVSMLRATHPNIYLTFTPEGVVNLSRKKLGVTLGIKAARYDIIVLTTTSVAIESPDWLRRMTRRFGPEGQGPDIVLGFAYVAPEEDTSFGRRRRAFDFVADSVRWLSVAIAGKPFRGTEYNIAYRKRVFMENKGFARTLNLHNGDDDIFVSEIVRRGNTEVELSDASMVRLVNGNEPRAFTERVLRRYFTESFIRRRPRLLHTRAGLLQIGVWACAVAAAVIAWPNIQVAIVGAIFIVAVTILSIRIWRSALIALKSRRLAATIPWLAMTYPFRKLGGKIHSRLGKQKKYTWD